MKRLLFIVMTVGFGTYFCTEKSAASSGEATGDHGCTLAVITYAWDFADGDHGFTTATCGINSEPAWEYGYVFGQYCFGTILDGRYPFNTGDSLISPPFMVTETARWVQIRHFYEAQTGCDGGNLTVNGDVVQPQGGYPMVLDDCPQARCVANEPAFSGTDQTAFIDSAFDLIDFMGQAVQLRFDFGSNDWNNFLGWYIASVHVGDEEVATEGVTWSRIKSLYR